MSTLLDRTHEDMKKGYDCAQSVVCTFSDELGLDEELLFKAAEAFGLGMGTMGTCGAITGMAMMVGLINSDGNLNDPESKKKSLELISQMTEEFRNKNGSIICKELKGNGTGVPLRSCRGCIEDAVEIIQKTLFSAETA